MYVNALAQFGTAMNEVMKKCDKFKTVRWVLRCIGKYLNILDTMRQGNIAFENRKGYSRKKIAV